jgi:5-formyltetrahydrofolate cyclo-ligase
MQNELKLQKQTLRAKIVADRVAMPFDRRASADAAITEAVCGSAEYKAAKQIFCYVSMPHEVSTRELLRQILRDGKTLGLPVCDTAVCEMTFYRLDDIKELQSGAYRIPVPPTDAARILVPDEDTLMIVPMLAFDAEGYRLGAGGGYYDRYLAKYPVKTLGICYADQKQTQLPHGEYDKKLARCITEQKTEEFYG